MNILAGDDDPFS